MDTYAPPMPRAEELDDPAAREADANPDADFNLDNVAPVTGQDAAETPAKGLNRWQTIGLIALGVAAVAGVGAAAYWGVQQQRKMKPQSLLEKMGVPQVDLSKAHPRRLSHMAARRIEQLPVRQLQKRVAHKVSTLFD